MPQEGQSGKSQGSDEFQPARRLAASVAPAPPRRLTSELQKTLIANQAMKILQPLPQEAAAIGPAFEVYCPFR